MTDFLPLPPPSPPSPPPRRRSPWLIPAIVIGVIVALVLIVAVVRNNDDPKIPPPPNSYPASNLIVSARNIGEPPPMIGTPDPSASTVEPTVEPSGSASAPVPTPSTSATVPSEAEILALIQDTFADYAEYSLEDGFQIPLDPTFVIVRVGEIATCEGFIIDGSDPFSYPSFWCPPNDTLYVSISSFRTIESQGFLTREAFLLNGWSVALTDAQNKTTLEYVACAFGTIARSDVDFEQITDAQASAIRDHFFPADTDPTRWSAFVTGYTGKTKISCDVYS